MSEGKSIFNPLFFNQHGVERNNSIKTRAAGLLVKRLQEIFAAEIVNLEKLQEIVEEMAAMISNFPLVRDNKALEYQLFERALIIYEQMQNDNIDNLTIAEYEARLKKVIVFLEAMSALGNADITINLGYFYMMQAGCGTLKYSFKFKEELENGDDEIIVVDEEFNPFKMYRYTLPFFIAEIKKEEAILLQTCL